jgi:hypothetical protein
VMMSKQEVPGHTRMAWPASTISTYNSRVAGPGLEPGTP